MSGETRAWYKKLWDGWMKIARAVGNFNARVILSLFYLIFMVPMGLFVRASRDFLGLRRPEGSGWIARGEAPRTIEESRKQF